MRRSTQLPAQQSVDPLRGAGSMDERNLVDRVRNWVHDPVHGEMLIEAHQHNKEIRR